MMYIKVNKDAPNIMHLIKPNTIGAEIGVWEGNTSKKFVERGVKELHLVDPYSVEPYKNNTEMSFQDYIAKYSKITGEISEAGFTRYYDDVYKRVTEKFRMNSNVFIHRMNSKQWFPANKHLKLDWIYVDGDHSYEGCLFDLENALPMIKKGGMILGDDYYWPGSKWGKKGVTEAVDQFLLDNKKVKSFKRFGETQFMMEI